MKLKNKTRKDLLKILLIIIISALSFYIWKVIANLALTTILEEGSLVDTTTYVIFTDGSTVYAKNGLSGAIEFSGTDAATVIQNVINALTNGGKILIREDCWQSYSLLSASI